MFDFLPPTTNVDVTEEEDEELNTSDVKDNFALACKSMRELA